MLGCQSMSILNLGSQIDANIRLWSVNTESNLGLGTALRNSTLLSFGKFSEYLIVVNYSINQ